jgi:hypothetical protein
VGLFYNSGKDFPAGVSYKTQQNLSEFEFENKYLDGSAAPGNSSKMTTDLIMI